MNNKEISIDLPCHLQKDGNQIVFEIPIKQIDHSYLSIASREMRNGNSLYQKKHITGTKLTKDRPDNFSNLNIEIPEHFQYNLNIKDILNDREPYVVFGVGDMTANLFRLSYDTIQSPPLFYLSEEPYREKEYYSFVSTKTSRQELFKFKKINFRNEIPFEIDRPISDLNWLFCSTPLVWQSKVVDNIEMAFNNYDLRHLFGKSSQHITNDIYKESVDQNLKFSYFSFIKAIEKRKIHLKTSGYDVKWYHAGLGIKENTLMILHHKGSLYDIANQFIKFGATEAVLLDSGGSSVIWTNIKKQGSLAFQENYHRSRRGAIVILKLNNMY
jgi:hypothetical protein